MHPPDYPEEYIDGTTTFYGRDFVVTPDVLIPRLETEGLVRRARQILQGTMNNEQGIIDDKGKMGVRGEDTVGTVIIANGNNGRSEKKGVWLPLETFDTFGHKSMETSIGKKIIVVDIGCGSGIIGTSVADLADEVIFLDISPAALRIAEENFRTHYPDKKAEFIVSDLLDNWQLPTTNCQLLFVTNLPYIKDADWKNMSADTVHEPKLALFGGEKTGFELYERLFEQLAQLPSLLGEGSGMRWSCIYEFGFDQRAVAEETIKRYRQWEYSFFADYAGIERFGEIK